MKTIRRYIRLNPARKLWKLAHPDRFICFQNIRHAVLDPSRRWQAMGDLTLLGLVAPVPAELPENERPRRRTLREGVFC